MYMYMYIHVVIMSSCILISAVLLIVVHAIRTLMLEIMYNYYVMCNVRSMKSVLLVHVMRTPYSTF